LDDYLRASGRKPGQCLFPGRRGPDQLTRHYARLVGEWFRGIGLDPLKRIWFGGPKATLICRRTGTCRLCSSCRAIGVESTVRYLVEVDDALKIAEKIDV